MAHHAADHEAAAGDILPRSPLMRALALAAFIIVVGALIAALWATGGLEKAADPPTSPPGTPLRNALLTITPRSASVVPATGDEKAQLRLKADLELHDMEPVRFYELNDIVTLRTKPGGKLKRMDVSLDRDPEGFYSFIQPEVREKVTMSWELPQRAADPASLDGATLTVAKAEFSPGFWDESSSWKSTDKAVGHIDLPVGKG